MDQISHEHPFSRRQMLAAVVGTVASLGLGRGLGSVFAQESAGGSAPAPAQAIPGASAAPRTNIDLSRWKLSLPVNKHGQLSGRVDAAEVSQLAGFQYPPFFVVTSSSITFAAPTHGARTGGSKYPRCELREMDGQGNPLHWTVSDHGRLSASVQINNVPATEDQVTGKLVIGQVHGPSDELCRLYYDNGNAYFINDKAGATRKETVLQLYSSQGNSPNIPVGSRLSYLIDVNSERIYVQVKHAGTVYSATDAIGTFWGNKQLYFKAGVYVQVGARGSGAGQVGTGAGSVTFFSLSATHG